MVVRGHPRLVLTAVAWLSLSGIAAAVTVPVTPSSNLPDVMAQVAEGDTIAFGCGVYRTEGLEISTDIVLSGVAGDPACVVLESSGQAPIITCTGVTNSMRIAHLTFSMQDGAVAAANLAGAALRLDDSSPLIENCRFQGLTASHGGAVSCTNGSAPILTNCRFEGNRAVVSGGAIMCCNGSAPTIVSSLFHDNAAAGSGGAIQAAMGSHPQVYLCTLAGNGSVAGSSLSAWDNSAFTVRSSIIVDGVTSPGWVGDSGSLPVVTCTDIHGHEAGDWVGLLAGQSGGSGNITADPLFCTDSALAEPFALEAASPCAAPLAACGMHLGAFAIGCGAHSAAETPPGVTRLIGNRPNPFNPGTVIHFELAHSGPVGLDVFDIGGRRLCRLVSGSLAAGAHAVGWDGRDDGGRPVAAGVYFYRLQSTDGHDIRSMVLVK